MSVNSGCLTCGGLRSETYTITVKGRDWKFDMHEQFGPTPLNKNGSFKESRTPKSFYRAVYLWCEQGKRIDQEGKCQWSYPPDPTEGMIKIGKRTYVSASIAKQYGLKQS